MFNLGLTSRISGFWHAARATLLSRWRQTGVYILAAESANTTEGQRGCAKTAQIRPWKELSGAVIISAKSREAAKLRKSHCLQCSAALKSEADVLLLATVCCLGTSCSGLIAHNFLYWWEDVSLENIGLYSLYIGLYIGLYSLILYKQSFHLFLFHKMGDWWFDTTNQ